jgi:hypothetical protein
MRGMREVLRLKLVSGYCHVRSSNWSCGINSLHNNQTLQAAGLNWSLPEDAMVDPPHQDETACGFPDALLKLDR